MLGNVGTEYGGNRIDLDLIPEGSTVISAGVGEDISFDLELMRIKGCKIIGIDPTIKSKVFMENHFEAGLGDFVFLHKALVPKSRENEKIKMYVNSNPDHVSDSELSHHRAASANFYEAETVTLDELLETYTDVSLIKLDIEGSEYGVVEEMPETDVPQMCIEFHHFCSEYTFRDTMSMVSKMMSMGYQHHPKINEMGQFVQTTLIKES
jgi:FkbM family methyltransferase